ncbi:hypothetical protein P879_09890 [Paragonimus westermani]|uniref:FHA domain-containing protein n=1 Tax=Paragonimus westermani TaxID=34504 RepID=A0A8T0D354_9TREM|nr:hypothetical protein P879_09890 [Paragonimus westermani]
MSDSILNRRSGSFGLHKPHYLPNLHRMSSSYFRSRSKRGSVTRNRARVRNIALPARKEPKNIPWLPGDDYLLINSVVMTCNLSEVFHTVRFAHFYTEKEIEARWRALLFDPTVSSTSLHAVSELPPAVKAKLDRLVPFSSYEDNLLAEVSFLTVFPDGVLKPMLLEDLQDSVFSRLLKEHPSVFYAGRDEVDLFRQWSRFQSCRVIKKGSPNTGVHNLSNGIEKSEDVQMATKLRRAASNAGCFASPTNVTLLNSPLGGDPESFSDTELLLEETVSGALAAGVDKLTEASNTARRHRMLGQSSYHGFQAHVTQCVLAALARHNHESVTSFAESLPTQSSLSASSSTSSVHLPNAALTNPVHSSIRTTQPTTVFSSHRNSYFGETMRAISRPKGIYSVETVAEVNDSFDLQRRLELYRRRRRLWARLRRSAEEANRWTRLVEIRATKGLELTDCQPIYPALAALTGSRTRYLIKEQEVIFGRSSFVYKPHIDLSLEGDATRVSRCHGRIRLTTDGTFWLANFSPHAVFVDGNPVLTGKREHGCFGLSCHV